MTKKKSNVLFVCVENSNRSQMAEAFARMHGDADVTTWSSGSRPSGMINPRAVAAMAELSYDLSQHRSKALNDLPQDIEWDYVVTMGCGDECPFLRAVHREDWALPDPRHMEREQFNIVRDEIERRVKQLLDRVQDEKDRPTAGD